MIYTILNVKVLAQNFSITQKVFFLGGLRTILIISRQGACSHPELNFYHHQDSGMVLNVEP